MQIDNMTKTLPKILKRSYTTVDPKQWMDSRRVLRNTVKTCQNHEKALRTPNSTLLWGKCKMGPPKKTRKETRWETRPREDGHTIQHQGGHLKKALRTPNSTLFAELCKTKLPATKGSKKRDRLGDKLGDKLRQRPQEGGHTIQHRETRVETMGDKGRRDLGKTDTPSNTGTDKTLGKADTPSNKGKQEGVQWETKGDKTLGKADTPSNTKADTSR